jgi:hypothetical protein
MGVVAGRHAPYGYRARYDQTGFPIHRAAFSNTSVIRGRSILNRAAGRDILRKQDTSTMTRHKQGFDVKKEVRKLARERVGTVPPSHPIPPKSKRKRPKHKKPPGGEEAGVWPGV